MIMSPPCVWISLGLSDTHLSLPGYLLAASKISASYTNGTDASLLFLLWRRIDSSSSCSTASRWSARLDSGMACIRRSKATRSDGSITVYSICLIGLSGVSRTVVDCVSQATLLLLVGSCSTVPRPEGGEEGTRAPPRVRTRVISPTHLPSRLTGGEVPLDQVGAQAPGPRPGRWRRALSAGPRPGGPPYLCHQELADTTEVRQVVAARRRSPHHYCHRRRKSPHGRSPGNHRRRSHHDYHSHSPASAPAPASHPPHAGAEG